MARAEADTESESETETETELEIANTTTNQSRYSDWLAENKVAILSIEASSLTGKSHGSHRN